MRLTLFALVSAAFTAAASAETHISISDGAPIGVIRPEIYGQFLEHVGTQVYDGLWVGEDSKIPNTDGVRDDVFNALDALDIPVLRWPGGCFADIYHWRDGVGRRGERKRRVNMSWGGTPEPNTFGTHEFFNLAERLGAKTYLNVNLGSGTLEEATDWLEYITASGASALAGERRRNGRAAPWKIDYLSIGNETWGCGGHMRPDYFADLVAQWSTFLKTTGEQPKRIISGSHDGNIAYSDAVLDHPDIHTLGEGVSLHYYTLPTSDWGDKGDALGFPEAEWASAIKRTLRMDALIAEQLAMIDAHEKLPDDFALYVDEWGVWTNTEEGAPALWQQNTIREAVVAALNFNIFHQHADRVAMTNIAQMVNVLQAMILTDGADMALTPTYHAFEMYKPFQGAEALRVNLESPVYEAAGVSFPALSASAARPRNGGLVVAVVNADASRAHDITFDLSDGAKVVGRSLSGDSLDAHNTMNNKTRVAPAAADFTVADGKLGATLPARSVTVFLVE